MQKRKTLFTLFICLLMICSLAGCSKEPEVELTAEESAKQEYDEAREKFANGEIGIEELQEALYAWKDLIEENTTELVADASESGEDFTSVAEATETEEAFPGETPQVASQTIPEEITTQAETEFITTEAVTSQPVTTEARTTEVVTTESVTTQAATTETVTTGTATTQAKTTQPTTTEKKTEDEMIRKDLPSFVIVSTEPVTAKARQSFSLYAGPSAEYDAVGKVATGEEVTIVGEANGCVFEVQQRVRIL